MTAQERERVQMFISEQKSDWEREESNKFLLAQREGKEYVKREFPGFSEEVALRAIRSGWKSQLDKLFDAKRKSEKW